MRVGHEGRSAGPSSRRPHSVGTAWPCRAVPVRPRFFTRPGARSGKRRPWALARPSERPPTCGRRGKRKPAVLKQQPAVHQAAMLARPGRPGHPATAPHASRGEASRIVSSEEVERAGVVASHTARTVMRMAKPTRQVGHRYGLGRRGGVAPPIGRQGRRQGVQKRRNALELLREEVKRLKRFNRPVLLPKRRDEAAQGILKAARGPPGVGDLAANRPQDVGNARARRRPVPLRRLRTAQRNQHRPARPWRGARRRQNA